MINFKNLFMSYLLTNWPFFPYRKAFIELQKYVHQQNYGRILPDIRNSKECNTRGNQESVSCFCPLSSIRFLNSPSLSLLKSLGQLSHQILIFVK